MFQQCSFDDHPLFTQIFLTVLAQIYPYGKVPGKVLRAICGGMDPRGLARLMAEMTKENVVVFGSENSSILQILTESLRWESIEQYMLWQIIQIEPVQFDEFFEIMYVIFQILKT